MSYAVLATQRIAHGDLSQRVELRPGDNSSLLHALQVMSEGLGRIVRDIRSGTEVIQGAAQEVAAGTNNLSTRTESQAASLEETASSMEQLTTAVRQNTEGAANASALAREADRIEQQDLDFFERVRAAYAASAAKAPGRIVRIDASVTVEAVGAQVLDVLAQRYPAC